MRRKVLKSGEARWARRRRRRRAGVWGQGVPHPSRLGDLGERRKLLQRGQAEIEFGKI